ncbi:hypothetical protein Tco_0829315 [Tanacetum coccineum]
MVVFLSKPDERDGFEQIVDFLNAHPVKYALTVNPTIYTSCIKQFWSTVKAKTINGEVQLHALVDGKKIIVTESTVIRDFQLEDDEGSAMPIDLQHTPTFIQPSPPPQKTQKPRNLKSERIKVPSHLEVPYRTLLMRLSNKELGDRLGEGCEGCHSLRLARNRAWTVVKKLEKKKKFKNSIRMQSKQGRRINAIDADEDITLVNVQDDADNEIFDVDTLTGDEVFAEQEVAAKDVNLTLMSFMGSLDQALAALKSVKPKVKGDVIKEPNVPLNAASAPKKAEVQEKGKGKMIKPKPMKPKKKDVQIMIDEEAVKKLQAEFDEEERLAKEKDEANIDLTEEWDDI